MTHPSTLRVEYNRKKQVVGVDVVAEEVEVVGVVEVVVVKCLVCKYVCPFIFHPNSFHTKT